MLPAVSSVYQQYKADTARIANWLGQAAYNHGYSNTDVFKPATAGCAGAREDDGVSREKLGKQLKNAKKKQQKARAKAKGQAGQADGGGAGTQGTAISPTSEVQARTHAQVPSSMESGSYTMRISDYLVIAQFLLDRAVTIPLELVQLLKRCIRLRKRACDKFASMAGIPELAKDGHEYFVTILNDVLALLEPQVDAARKAAATTGTSQKEKEEKDKDEIPSSNRFAGLKLDDTDEAEDMADIDLPRPPNSTAGTIKMSFSIELDRDEGLVRALTFFSDVASLRAHFKELWNDYAEGSVDLITASTVTNTGIELLRKPHDSLVLRVLPLWSGDLRAMYTDLFAILSGNSRNVFEEMDGEKGDKDDKSSKGGIQDILLDRLMVPAYQSLELIRDHLPKTGLCMPFPTGRYGDLALINPSTSPAHERQHQRIVLWDIFTEYFLFGQLNQRKDGSTPHRFDEMNLLMHDLAQTRTITLMTVVAAQVFYDIYRTMKGVREKPIEDMRATMQAMVATLNAREEAALPSLGPPGSPARLLEGNIVAMHESLENALESSMMDNALVYLRLTSGQDVQFTSQMLEANPVLCGGKLFEYKLAYQGISVSYVNSWGSILAAAYIYQAALLYLEAQGKDAIESAPTWDDMHVVIDEHVTLFPEIPPRTVEDLHECFMYAQGFTVDSVVAMKNINAGRPNTISRMRRVQAEAGHDFAQALVPYTPLISIFSSKYHTPSKEKLQEWAATGQDLGLLLEDHPRKQMGSRHIEELLKWTAEFNMLTGAGASDKDGSSKNPIGDKQFHRVLRRVRKHRSNKLSTLQLLSVLEDQLDEESSSLRFDYMSMHLRCIRVVYAIRDTVEPLIRPIAPEFWEDNQMDWPGTIILQTLQGYCLGKSAAKENSARHPMRKELGVLATLMDRAVDTLKEVLTPDEVDVELKKMEAELLMDDDLYESASDSDDVD